MGIHLGCIADDFTGATDLANNLVRAGMRVIQTINTPGKPPDAQLDADAVVIALKSRTIPAADAVAQSLAALEWLRLAGAEQIYFKYCSTFDSTPDGNIGPVAEALLDALGADLTVATPAFPDNSRTVFTGHLFVGDELLSDSGMRHHPLTPMTDANLVRVLQAQCRGKVGLVDHTVVAAGPDAILERFAGLRTAGASLCIVDAITNDDLLRLGHALAGFPLITGGSGLAIGLPANWGITPSADAASLPPAGGRSAIVSGSASAATNGQVGHAIRAGMPAFAVDPLRIVNGDPVVAEALAFADARLDTGPVLVYSTASPEAVQAVQGRLGATQAGDLVERTLADVANGLITRDVRRLIVAGGETSGAVVQALGIDRLRIGAQIDPGVPWCAATLPGGETLHITLKSGNFGTPAFFTKALKVLR